MRLGSKPILGLAGLVGAALAAMMPLGAGAQTFPLSPDQTAVGSVMTYTTRAEDTLVEIARTYDLGYTELITANKGVDPWLPGAGKTIVIPNYFLIPDAPRTGIVVNLTRQRLFYFPPGGKTVETYPIGVGVEGWVTPEGLTKIVRKREHPAWDPPPSILAERPELPAHVPPGPDNPMGEYAMYLGWPLYAIHGTNRPYGVGRNVSHGCIHLYPEDIEVLFKEIKVGTPVRVVDDEAQVAWIGDDLYLDVFPNKRQTDDLDVGDPYIPVAPDGLWEKVFLAAFDQTDRIDWKIVDEVARERTGIPTKITKPSSVADTN